MQIAAQGLALLFELFWSIARAICYIPYALLIIISQRVLGFPRPAPGALFYKGLVMHTRKRPKVNNFSYPVRLAVIDLDSPPAWWTRGRKDCMSAEEARHLAATDGPVKLLTNPTSAGYYQNPISVYYCYSSTTNSNRPTTRSHSMRSSTPNLEIQPQYTLRRCLAEVTNTPWGERVTFGFDPVGEEVPKALHVSPFMDMKNTWTIKARAPGSKLFLSVAADHPEHGPYFLATLTATLDQDFPHQRNELASIDTLLQFGFQPQRVAFWIYCQAVKLIWKGVSFYGPPGEEYKKEVGKKARHEVLSDGRLFAWRDALGWPWK